MSGSWFPTRVIDIGLPEATNWRLCVSAEKISNAKDPPPYLALSYRWGPDPGVLLLSSTMNDLRRGRPIAELPKTFRDLFIVARRLNIRYIWIDAMCIIQDSAEDWGVEALKMRNVYANAACTIAASGANDENEGLFHQKNSEESSIEPGCIKVTLPTKETRVCQLYERDYWNQNTSTGSLHKRGWVFQERHLSPRILYFTRQQILWECLERARCEVFPEGIPHHASEKNQDELWGLFEQESDDEESSQGSDNDTNSIAPGRLMPANVYVLWRDLVKDYAQCSFTKVSDRLIAFSGIAKLFCEATGDTYLAGLWRSWLVEGLDWRVAEPRMKDTSLPYRAPSWSWISTDGPLRLELPTPRSQYLISVVDAVVQTQGLDPMGSVIDGYLKLIVCLNRAICIRSAICAGGSCTLIMNGRPSEVVLRPDYLETLPQASECVYFFPCHSYMAQGSLERPEVLFLWIRPDIRGARKAYRRCGYFIFNMKDWTCKKRSRCFPIDRFCALYRDYLDMTLFA
jgi:hypothetical protein